MTNVVKKALRSNKIICFLIYLIKYKMYYTVKYYIKYYAIKISPNSPVNCDVAKLKNSKKGRACIVVGNGPSVQLEDLDAIQKSGIDSFGANRILDILDRTIWRPTYLCVMDPAFIIGVNNTCSPEEYSGQIAKWEIEKIFFNDIIKKRFDGLQGSYFINCPLALIFSDTLMPFSENASRYVSDMGSVTHFSIQLAYFMGYSTIYLYGMDNTYVKYLDNDGIFKINNSIDSHISGMKTNVDDEKQKKAARSKFEAYETGGYSDKRKNDTGYRMCKQFADTHGLEIINLTHGGALDFFDRAEFDSVFEKNAEETNYENSSVNTN